MNEFQRRIGVGEPCRAFGKHHGTTRARPVVADDGPARGKVVGEHVDHWDGRVDAVARPEPIRLSPEQAAMVTTATTKP